MSFATHSTPLVSLDAVVLDTETTGLDARTARLIQIGALRLKGGKIAGGERFEQIVDPGVPIPAASSAVHGLADADVRGKPRFAAVWPDFDQYLGRSILIGHTIAFDINILKREVELSRGVWRQRRALDIRQLARLAAPTLADYELSRLAAWLNIEIVGRHTAMGDAEATARIYAALVPLLRARNIRTLAEAEAATRQLQEQEARAAGGLMSDVAGPISIETPRALTKLDSFPYRHRVAEVMSAPPITLPGEASLKDAIDTMMARKISSVFIKEGERVTGILTQGDALRAIHKSGGDALGMRALEVMSKPLNAVNAQAFVYRAIGRMDRLGFRHLGVRDAMGNIVGAVTTRNLLRHRASAAIMLGDEIESAQDAAALGAAWARLPLMAKNLKDEDIDPRTISAIISSEIQVFTRRAAQLAEAQMSAAGKGLPPVRYAVLVLGSAGRGESLLAADQDNAIVYEHGEAGGTTDAWFAEMAEIMCAILDEVGIPLCKGGVMAKNPQWRMSLEAWQDTIRGWVRRQRPEDLLNVDIFFDSIPVHGDVALGESVWSYAFEVGHRSPDFVKLLEERARQWTAPFTLFGSLRVDEQKRVDLKKGGLMPIFSGARALAIRHDARLRSTPERLTEVASRGHAPQKDIDTVIDAHKVILGAMLDQQLADSEQGIPLSTRVEPDRFRKIRKGLITDAVSKVKLIVDLVGEGRI